MDMGDIIVNSFKYPLSNWKRFLLFGLIVLIYELPVQIISKYSNVLLYSLLLIIPVIIAYFLMMGYQLQVIGRSIKREDEIPALNKWSQMFIDGLKVFIVSFIYGIGPAIVLVFGLVLILTGSTVAKVIGAIVLMIAFLLFIVAYLILMMALPNMAYYGDTSAGLRLGEIYRKIKKIGRLEYVLIFIILMIVVVLLAFAAGFISLIPIIGSVIASFTLIPFSNLFTARAYGLIYKETLDEEVENPQLQVENPLETEIP
ncbi:DUF4013 domain-containing protein [Methanobacterium petrolearium]|uniref:DUF4013 domain-containing protein n=1 Tax=Methanobacterium petrolearium TaxID=710190 RepID=UPI001AE82251|nr:DUF4013 domain-containing protein [Methanobacterium petrolearium]MBP1944793.1 hypothetical protein [Methanobacterium petrolearium]BDZ70072.1 hypothetical protein GCM10025861_05890 [Methanobacterium petrolearium]